jgi:hypothetical protein
MLGAESFMLLSCLQCGTSTQKQGGVALPFTLKSKFLNAKEEFWKNLIFHCAKNIIKKKKLV